MTVTKSKLVRKILNDSKLVKQVMRIIRSGSNETITVDGKEYHIRSSKKL